MNPNLSIIIPCYNYAHYLRASIDSVLQQDYSDYELLLIDDGSTDGTWSIMNEYADQHSHIRIFKHPTNLGIFKANQTGWDASRGDYLHFFSADDLYHPHCLQKVMQSFEENPHCGLVCTDISYMTENGPNNIQKLLSEQTNPRFFGPQELISLFRSSSFWIPGLCCIVKAQLLQKYGHLDPKLENISDWFCFHKIALFEGIGYIPETLISMRLHDQTYTSRVKRDKKRRRATYDHLLKILAYDREAQKLFQQSQLLTFVFRELGWKWRLNPHYFSYWTRHH